MPEARIFKIGDRVRVVNDTDFWNTMTIHAGWPEELTVTGTRESECAGCTGHPQLLQFNVPEGSSSGMRWASGWWFDSNTPNRREFQHTCESEVE